MSSQLTDATVTHRDKRGSIARVAPLAGASSGPFLLPGPMRRVLLRPLLFIRAPRPMAMHRSPSGLAATQPTPRSGLTPVGARVHTGHPDVSEVSDSEPEREERRKREREGRKRRKKHHPPLQCHTDVIELTDSQEPILTQPTSQPSQVPPTTQSIISIHGMLHLPSDRILHSCLCADDSSEPIPDDGRDPRDERGPEVLDEGIIEISGAYYVPALTLLATNHTSTEGTNDERQGEQH